MFCLMFDMRLLDNAKSLEVRSADDCESACLNNCSCNAYSYNGGCSLWYGDLNNLQDEYNGTDGGTLYLQLAASELASYKSHKGLINGFVFGVVIAFLAFLVVLSITVWRR